MELRAKKSPRKRGLGDSSKKTRKDVKTGRADAEILRTGETRAHLEELRRVQDNHLELEQCLLMNFMGLQMCDKWVGSLKLRPREGTVRWDG